MIVEFPFVETCRLGRTVLVRRFVDDGPDGGRPVKWQVEVNGRRYSHAWSTRKRAIAFARSIVRQINKLDADPLTRDPMPGREDCR